MVANIIEDYFPKYNPVLGPEHEDDLQKRMKALQLKFNENQQKIPVPDKTVDLMKQGLPAVVVGESHEGTEKEVIGLKVVEIEGKQFVCH